MDDGWKAVAAHVKRRRNALGLTQDEAVALADGGVSVPVWSNIENARQTAYKYRTLAAVERALRWEDGSIQRIRDGGPPIERNPVTAAESAHVGRLREAVRAERERRGWSYKDTECGGYDSSLWEAFEAGGPFNIDIQYAVCVAFNWNHDWPNNIAHGIDPGAATYDQFQLLTSDVLDRLAALEARLAALEGSALTNEQFASAALKGGRPGPRPDKKHNRPSPPAEDGEHLD